LFETEKDTAKAWSQTPLTAMMINYEKKNSPLIFRGRNWGGRGRQGSSGEKKEISGSFG